MVTKSSQNLGGQRSVFLPGGMEMNFGLPAWPLPSTANKKNNFSFERF